MISKKSLPRRPKEPPAPRHLSRAAKVWWKKVVAEWELDDPGLLLLESALESYDTMRAAQALLKADGMVILDRFGQKKAHPATLIERDAKGVLLRTLKALNLDLEPLNPQPGRQPGR